MNAKATALLVVAIVLAVGIYFVGKSLVKSGHQPKKEQPAKPSPEEKTETAQPSTAEQAYQAFLKWKAAESPAPEALDGRLEQLAVQFPADYRYPLERIRGAANIKGVHSHAEEFEILEAAARKAIACQCGDAEKLRSDLLANKDQKSEGFWKLSTHPRQWEVVIEALEQQDAGLMEKSGGHQH